MDAELLAKRKKMQMEIMLKESDMKRNERLKAELEIAIRDMKHKELQLQTEEDSKESMLKKVEAEISQMQNELIKLKHKMNTLGHEQ